MKNDVPQMFVSEHLPADARAILQRAAATRLDGDPMARRKAIDQATKVVRRMYPAYFKPRTAEEIEFNRMTNKE